MTEPKPAGRSSYVHGADAAEQARLGVMNSILNPRHLELIGPIDGQRVLELGAGTGLFAQELSRAAGSAGRVVAVERDASQLALARNLSKATPPECCEVELREGDVFDLPLDPAEWGTFDLVHARFLLEHVPDPGAVVALMLRAARPGGRLVLADDDHDVMRLDPPAPSVEALWAAYVATYQRVGNDPFVGRRLVGLLADAGAEARRNEWVFFGSCCGAAQFEAVIDNMTGILAGARALILEGFSEEAYERGMREFASWRRQPSAALWFAMCFAEGRRPR